MGPYWLIWAWFGWIGLLQSTTWKWRGGVLAGRKTAVWLSPCRLSLGVYSLGKRGSSNWGKGKGWHWTKFGHIFAATGRGGGGHLMSKGIFKQSSKLIQRKILHKHLSNDKTLHQWQERDRIKCLDNSWEEGKWSNKAEIGGGQNGTHSPRAHVSWRRRS